MFKWKQKEAVVVDIIFRLIVNKVRKIAAAKASWLILWNMLMFAELPDLRRPVPQEITLPSLTCEVRTTETESPTFIDKSAQTYVTRLFA